MFSTCQVMAPVCANERCSEVHNPPPVQPIIRTIWHETQLSSFTTPRKTAPGQWVQIWSGRIKAHKSSGNRTLLRQYFSFQCTNLCGATKLYEPSYQCSHNNQTTCATLARAYDDPKILEKWISDFSDCMQHCTQLCRVDFVRFALLLTLLHHTH